MISEDALKYLQKRGGTASFLSLAQGAHHALAFLVSSGVIDHLDTQSRPVPLDELATTFALRRGALAAVFELMLHFEIVERRGDGFVLGAEGRLLGARARNHARYSLLSASFVPAAYLQLGEMARSGKTGVEAAYGEKYHALAAKSPLVSGNIDDLCDAFLTECDLLPSFASLIATKGHRTIADLSGGRGTLLRQILKCDPSCRGILMSGSPVHETDAESDAQGPRPHYVDGDLFAAIPAADAHLLANVFFNFQEEDIQAILRNIHAVKQAGEALYILDFYADASFESACLNLDELFISGGAVPSLSVVQRILENSGFKIEQTIAGEGPFRGLVCTAVT